MSRELTHVLNSFPLTHTGAPLDPKKIVKLGTVLSRFEFNKMPNPAYKPGPFQLLLDGGVRAYKAPRPQIVMVSSAGALVRVLFD